MIQEAYCSFEVAKLLKEKGFNELCFRLIRNDGEVVEVSDQAWNGMTKKQKAEFYLCPTHQLAMRWLREVKNIHLSIIHSNIDDRGYWFAWSNEFGFYESDQFYKTYEEATEAALKYALEVLI